MLDSLVILVVDVATTVSAPVTLQGIDLGDPRYLPNFSFL